MIIYLKKLSLNLNLRQVCCRTALHHRPVLSFISYGVREIIYQYHEENIYFYSHDSDRHIGVRATSQYYPTRQQRF